MFRNTITARSAIIGLVLGLILTLPSCRDRDNVSAPGTDARDQPAAQADTDGGDHRQMVRLTSPYTGTPVVWINQIPFSAEQIDRFLKTMVSPSHMAGPHGEPGSRQGIERAQAMDSFARFISLVEEGVRLGLEDDARFKHAFDVHHLSVLGEDYLKHLLANAPLDPEALKARLPSDWVRMNFEIKVLPADQDPLKIKKPETETDWLDLPWVPLTADPDKIPETGWVFPDSGFFDREIDAHLFTLGEGDLDGPIRTGVGEAFVRVKEKQVLGPEEIDEEIRKIRGYMSEEYRERQLKEARSAMREFIDLETFEQCAWEEIENGRQPDRTVFSHGDLELSYPVFRSQDPYNLDFNAQLSSPNVAVGQLGLRLQYFAGRLDLGRKALAEGFEPASKWQKAIFDYYVRSLYSLAMERMEESFREAAEWPTRDMALSFYEERKQDRYRVPSRARVTYLQGPNRDQLNRVQEDLEQGRFTMDDIPPDRLMRSPHGRQIVRKATVVEGEDVLGEIQDGIFSMAEGEIKLLDGRAQSYLVRLEARQTGSLLPFEQVADQVEEDLYRLTWATRMNLRLAEIYDGLDVRFHDPSSELPKGQTAPAHMDRI